MTIASARIARFAAIRAAAGPRPATAPVPRPAPEPIEIELDLAGCAVQRSTTRDGVPYARFSGATRTILAFGEIADVACESMRVVGMAVERGSTLKIVGIRPFEQRATMVNEMGDPYEIHGPAVRAAA